MGARHGERGQRLAHAHPQHRTELTYTTCMAQRFAVVAAALLVSGAAVLSAAVPSFWQVATQADFLKGEVENLSIDAHGRLMLGPASTALYESNAPFLWNIVTGTDGAMYVGSGNEGQVFRIDTS